MTLLPSVEFTFVWMLQKSQFQRKSKKLGTRHMPKEVLIPQKQYSVISMKRLYPTQTPLPTPTPLPPPSIHQKYHSVIYITKIIIVHILNSSLFSSNINNIYLSLSFENLVLFLGNFTKHYRWVVATGVRHIPGLWNNQWGGSRASIKTEFHIPHDCITGAKWNDCAIRNHILLPNTSRYEL